VLCGYGVTIQQVVEPIRRAYCERSVAPGGQREDRVTGEALLRCQSLPRGAVEVRQAIAVGACPNVALVREESADCIAGQAICGS